jgi:hypothetical protein
VPPRFPLEKAISIQTRVAVTLKYWIENQFDDLDDALIARLFHFFDERLKHGGKVLSKIAEQLNNKLRERVAARSAKLESLLTEPPLDLRVRKKRERYRVGCLIF